MIRHAVCTVSAAATLALTAAAPAIACDHPESTSTPQAQQEHAKFADKGFFRHHHHHHMRGFDEHAQSSDQQSSDQQSSDSQQQGNCDHGDSND
jgi:Spy/CpxP family protein refolding chaperone